MNCGLVYVQNAARDGPTAWILAELEDRSVRVWENIPGVKVRSIGSLHTDCLLTGMLAGDVAGITGVADLGEKWDAGLTLQLRSESIDRIWPYVLHVARICNKVPTMYSVRYSGGHHNTCD